LLFPAAALSLLFFKGLDLLLLSCNPWGGLWGNHSMWLSDSEILKVPHESHDGRSFMMMRMRRRMMIDYDDDDDDDDIDDYGVKQRR